MRGKLFKHQNFLTVVRVKPDAGKGIGCNPAYISRVMFCEDGARLACSGRSIEICNLQIRTEHSAVLVSADGFPEGFNLLDAESHFRVCVHNFRDGLSVTYLRQKSSVL